MNTDPFACKKRLDLAAKSYQYCDLSALDCPNVGGITGMPFSIRVLLEQALRNYDDFKVTQNDIRNIAAWSPTQGDVEIPFIPTRVVLQDFTGVPTLVDLASLRSAMDALRCDPQVINPKTQVDLVIDHSVQIGSYGTPDALQKNMDDEFRNNAERYKFLKWGQNAFENFRIIPPGAGVIHQVNLEYLACVVQEKDGMLFPDTVVGTDSHTTMINGLGVLGWGVGGIEAESAMLGQPISMKLPDVIGFRLKGKPKAGTTATDIVLTITEILRAKGVVEKVVEFFGSGLSGLNLADRATIANMAPEYGATMGFFPVDSETISYLHKTGRDESLTEQVEAYYKAQGMFRDDNTPDPTYTDVVELDLGDVVPSLAGPRRPQDRIRLSDMQKNWQEGLSAERSAGGFAVSAEDSEVSSPVAGTDYALQHGSIAIAAITSCTNTSNPSVLMAAGLLAKAARERGLHSKPWVKTSLAPGSRVVTDFLEKANLQEALNELGFYTAGYGCTTCIGNSGPLREEIVDAIREKNLVASAVLSGNRNFEGRIHAEVKANFLASPPLVVAYAIAGTVNIDLQSDPLGTDHNGEPVYLADIWPSEAQIAQSLEVITPEMYRDRYNNLENIAKKWVEIEAGGSAIYNWDSSSTYIQNPPFFQGLTPEVGNLQDISGARVLAKLGHSVTTDHISPAGAFKPDTPAGKYLTERGVDPRDFNSYGSRRGNDKIMTRGTFANVRLSNLLAPGTEGGFTTHFPSGEQMSIFEASERYKAEGVPLVVLAGKEYGTGSSRDWAAKGTYLLGVRAVIAESYERIHRSNLIGMGVLPLQFINGQSADSLGLSGTEEISITGLHNDMQPGSSIAVRCGDISFEVRSRLDTLVEVEYLRNGGILHSVLRKFIQEAA